MLPALAVALVLSWLVPSFVGSQTETRDGLTFAADDLERALDEQLVADQPQGSETRILFTFADARGKLCRGFVRADSSGIACRRDGGWHLRVQRDGIDISANDHRQASSVDRGIATAAKAMADSPMFDDPAERAAKARGWPAQ